MTEKPHIRRFIGLTLAMLGLTSIFASLTAVAVSRPGLAAAFALGGLALAVFGLWWLPRDAG
jgi:hypothetical protein